MKRTIYISFLVIILSIVMTACGKGDAERNSQGEDKKIKINTTVYPLKSFAEQIGGEHVSVESIYPAGTDMHSFEPTQKDIINASKADLFIYTGDDLDPVAKKVAATIKTQDKKLALEDKLDKSQLLTDQHSHEESEEHNHEGHHHHGGYDPHIWLDPQFDQTFAKEIKDELIKKDPNHKKEYEKNYKKLNKELAQIDEKMKDTTKDKKGNAVFISHESMGYLADRYGFVQKGVQNMNAEDPSQKDLTKIVKEINESGTKYILYEDNVSNKVTDTIRKETKAKPLKFYNMESLTKAQQSDRTITFQSLMEKNIKHINMALNDNIKVNDDSKKNKHEKAISEGYFKDSQVKDRKLSDYNGDWQSIYPYLKDGSLDEVMKHKANEDDSMSEKEYKAYYEKGYKTDIEKLKINNDTIEFTKDGKKMQGQYKYDGKDILKYEKGNRGVRFTYKLTEGDDKTLPKYVQFSDHNIAPTKSHHFHIFIGNDKGKLLKELDNWPTYYPQDLTKKEVKEEMLAH